MMLLHAARPGIRTLALVTSLFATLAHATVINSPQSILVLASGQSATVVDGGKVSSLIATGNSHVTSSGGTISRLNLQDQSTALIEDGEIGWLRLQDQGSVKINGANELRWLIFESDDARAEIVADDLRFNGGHVYGTWADGTAFSFWALKLDELQAGPMEFTQPIGLSFTTPAVPEPSTSAMLSMGLMAAALTLRHRQGRA